MSTSRQNADFAIKLFMPTSGLWPQSYHREGAMDPIWVASAWKFPWRHRPPQRKPRLDLTDTTLVSIGGPVAEAICIPGLASLPQEVLQMVRRSKGYKFGQSITTFGPTLAHTFPLHKDKQIALSFLKSTDSLLRIGVGDAWQRHIEICTKLTGAFLFGPYQCYTDTDNVSGNEPSVLVHNVPTKRVGGSLGIVTEHNFESESLLSLPRYHKDDKDPSRLRCINTEVPAKNITHADVYYNRRNGYCEGLLLEYANGAQRALSVRLARIATSMNLATLVIGYVCVHEEEGILSSRASTRQPALTYREKPVLERLWVAAVWRTPWIVSSLKPRTQLDIVDNGLVSISLSTAEILGLPQLTTLPSEVLQLIRAYSRGSFIWTYPAIKAKAEEMARFDESISKDDGMQYNLRIVKEWHRGQDAELDEDPPESAQRTWVYFKFGHARMILSPSWPRTFQIWDIPSPPTKGLEVLLRPRRTDATCNRTLDLRNITGITFFFYRGTLMGLHAHTLGAVTAVSTVKDTLSDYEPHLVWIHIPIPHGDRIMRFGLRTWRNEHEEPANHHTALLMTTKLAGDFSLGPSFDMEDQNFLFQGTPTVLVHNTPGKGGITLLGIAGDEPQETLPAPRFPVISLSPYELAYGGNAITVDISLKGTVRVDIFKDSSTGCFRGFLLEYENGSQRSAGQCRVGVDPVTVCHKPVSFCYRKVQGGDFDVHKYYELECCPETGDPHYDHASPDGAWTCSDFGVYAKVWCNDVTTELYTYTPRSQEFITIEDLIQQCPPGNLSEESDYYDYEAFADNFDDEPLYWPEPGVEEEEDERHICL
ncbi:hypothetical protein FOXG_01160 [Fusarium oxysporum f. sp. lycopersici 4287]|uniref:Uncharacterized protein n=2 Tax=Fusarium oxysporum TaxID=5507 RepID=A0A0J9WGV8_FUSO4|nr:hypothetical protein FOXG_01160 [Fusarium oxysporum f. sp. lycopersici 4287]KNA95706.1 hypothetical protein FOXG_01160 [Fusarium oxysporum f. sp. lycopersici 4287]